MATGDVRGNFERLKVQLRSISYPHALDIQGCNEGLPAAILPLIHYALLGYSRHVARYLSVNGYVLYAKSDLRFVECVMKLLRKEFEYRCPLTIAQIFGRGFAEKKFLFVHDLIQDRFLNIFDLLRDQMCKRKHNDLLRVVRNSEKKTPVCRPKAFGTLLHQSQRRPILRNKHLSSKFDRRCELDLLPDIKCREVRQRSSCQDNTWFVPPEGRTRLSGVAEEDEDDIRAQSLQRAKQRGLRVLTRVKDHNIDATCHIPHMHIGTGSSAIMGAQMIHRDRGCGSMSSDPAFQGRDREHEETSPRSSSDFTRPKHGNTSMSFGDYPVPLEEPVTNKKFESQSQTPTTPENNCPLDHLHKNHLASSKACGRFDIPTLITADDPPQAMWQKIIDLASKIDSCFCSLDNKIAQSFNSLDEKLETKFKYLDEGVASTRETLQEKLIVLENRIENLERTSQISPMSLQSNVTYNDSHPIRDITNTFNSSIDNRSWRNYPGLPLRDPLIYYPNLFQQQDTQSIQNIPMHAGLLRTNTQDFIACVKARFHQTKEMLNVNDTLSF
nr:uncharacterized protein LOC112294470 isoform X2 [Physcomitrium patens]|eukprot:XP_024400709.1 uncharacterized protein LOC112294470 isoform X2 [Physcomitrella patens]